jgi:competence protein ComEA
MQGTGTRWFDLSGSELRVLLVAAAIVLLSLVVLGVLRSALREPEIRVEHVRESLRMPERTDVNTATEYQLRLLPGIGSKTARDIVEDRQSHGPFRTLEDLTRVRGIGPKTLELVRPHLMCRPPEAQGRD